MGDSGFVNQFLWPVRVYYEDTDAGGVVFYANYLKYMERARTEWLRSLGYEQDELAERGVLFAVRRVEVDYRRPARFNQRLQVSATIIGHRRTSLTFAQQISHDDQLLCEGRVEVACVSAGRFRPQAVPADILEKITQ